MQRNPYIFAFLALTAAFLLVSAGGARAQTVDTWDPRAAAAVAVSAIGNKLAYTGSGDFMYQLRGDDTSFNRYSISGDSWSALTASNCGAGVGNGTFLIRGDSGILYASCPGTNGTTDFVRYTISSGTWANRAAPISAPSGGFTFGNGAAAVWDGSNTIYALGGGSDSFGKYSISGDSWTGLANTPAIVSFGGSLAYPGSGDFLYAFRGGDTNTFWRYSISGNSWTAFTPAVALGTVAGGGALVAPNTSTIYALRGSGGGSPTTDFWSYGISGDSWTALAAAPAAVGDGGSLAFVSNSSGTFLFALRGNSTTDFNRFTISLTSAGGGLAVTGPRAFEQQQFLLARATPPSAPADAVFQTGACNGTCAANVTFNYVPLPPHNGRPTRFEYVDDAGKILGALDVPAATGGAYELALTDLPENGNIRGAICSVFGVSRSCMTAHGSTLYRIVSEKLKVATGAEDVASGLFTAAIAFDALPNNATVGKTGFLLEILADGGKAPQKITEYLLAFKSNPVPLPKAIPAGDYIFRLTPRNLEGVSGVPAEKAAAIAAPLPPLGGTAEVRVADGNLVAEINAELPRDIGDFLLIDPRFALERIVDKTARPADALPPALRGGFTFTLSATDKSVPPRTVQFEGICNGERSGGCIVSRATNTVGNATGAITPSVKRTAAGGAIAAAGDATLLWSPGFFPLSVTLGQIVSARLVLTTPLRPIHDGRGELTVLLRDLFRNEFTMTAAPFTIAVPREVADVTVNTFDAAQDRDLAGALQLTARGSVTNNASGAALLAVNIQNDAEEDVGTTLRAWSIAVVRGDGATITATAACAETCAVHRATATENEDGTASASIDGTVFTFDPANTAQFSVLVGSETAAAMPRQIAFTAGYEPLAQSGLYTATLTANNASAAYEFLAAGARFDLGALITPRNVFDLAPSFVFYPAPENLPPQVEVEGGRIMQKPIIQRIADTLAPTNPLINILRNLFAPQEAE